MATLIVSLTPQPATSATEFDWLLTPDGVTLADHGSAPTALLPRPAGASAEVVAIVPAAALSWHQVDLPKGTQAGSPRLRAVLEGLLEERLLDEPQELHFALQPQARAGAPVWVAACRRDWLRQQLVHLEAAQRPASRIVPEFTPTETARLHATGDPQAAQLVLTSPDGVLALPLAGPAAALLPPGHEELPLLAEPGAAALAEQVLQRPVALEQAPQRWLRAAQSGWDLAQFDLTTSGHGRALRRLAGTTGDLLRAPQWRPARWAAVLLLAANLVGLNAWAWKERAALAGKSEAIRGTLTTTFPQVKVVVEPATQMEKEVAALRQVTGASSGRDLEAMLAALAAAVPGQRVLSGIEYASGELRARGLGLTAEEAATVSATLQGQGYAARLDGDVLVLRPEGAR